MDMNSRMAMAEKLSVAQLQQAIQSGSLPAYIGIPLIEQKNKERAQMAAAQGGQQKPPSVASQILQQAEQGVEQLPSNLPVSQDMAGGGIIAFAEGGDAEDFDVEAYREQQDEDEYADILRSFMAASDAASEEGVSSRKKGKKYADGGIAAFNGAYGSLVDGEAPSAEFDPRYEDTEPFDIGSALDQARIDRAAASTGLRGLNPKTDKFKFDAEKNKLNTLTGRERKLQEMYENQMASSPAARPANILDLYRARPGMLPANAVPTPNVPYAPPSAVPTLSPVVVTPETATQERSAPLQSEKFPDEFSEEAASVNAGIVNAPGAKLAPLGTLGAPRAAQIEGAPQGSRATTPAALVNQLAEQTGRPRSAYDDFLDEIRAGREDLKTQAQKDKYMAIISAGLGMMSGTSPNAFANIGQGAQAGVASYMASGKQRAAEKAALNKNLLMGRRYQSMEDIANRTADINERRYAAIAAARGAGAGSSLREEEQDRKRLNDLQNGLQRLEKTETDRIKEQFNPMIYPKEYAAAMSKLRNDPKLLRYNAQINSLFDKMYGAAEAPAPTGNSGGSRIRVDQAGNIIP
jgi:hypothetical protein